MVPKFPEGLNPINMPKAWFICSSRTGPLTSCNNFCYLLKQLSGKEGGVHWLLQSSELNSGFTHEVFKPEFSSFHGLRGT